MYPAFTPGSEWFIKRWIPVRPLFTPTLSQAGLKSDRVFCLEGGDDKTVLASATAEATLSWRKSLGWEMSPPAWTKLLKMNMIGSRCWIASSAICARKSEKNGLESTRSICGEPLERLWNAADRRAG